MEYLINFINEVNQLNLNESSEQKALKICLLNSISKALQEQLSEVDKFINALGSSDTSFQTQLIAQQQQLQGKQQEIGRQIEQLSQEGQQLPEIGSEAFIDYFAGHFTNIKHLMLALSDAPQEIKGQQTALCFKVLANLSDRQRFEQLKELSQIELAAVIKGALKAYDKELSENQTARLKYRQMAQAALFIQLQKLNPQSSWQAKEVGNLLTWIPEVGKSDILSDFYRYQPQGEQRTVAQMLSVLKSVDYLKTEEDREKYLQVNQAFHKLRFGQDVKQQYLKTVQAHLKEDLLWARGIYEQSLYQSGSADKVYELNWQQQQVSDYYGKHGLAESALYKSAGVSQRNSLTLQQKKLVLVFEGIKQAIKSVEKEKRQIKIHRPGSLDGRIDVTNLVQFLQNKHQQAVTENELDQLKEVIAAYLINAQKTPLYGKDHKLQFVNWVPESPSQAKDSDFVKQCADLILYAGTQKPSQWRSTSAAQVTAKCMSGWEGTVKNQYIDFPAVIDVDLKTQTLSEAAQACGIPSVKVSIDSYYGKLKQQQKELRAQNQPQALTARKSSSQQKGKASQKNKANLQQDVLSERSSPTFEEQIKQQNLSEDEVALLRQLIELEYLHGKGYLQNLQSNTYLNKAFAYMQKYQYQGALALTNIKAEVAQAFLQLRIQSSTTTNDPIAEQIQHKATAINTAKAQRNELVGKIDQALSQNDGDIGKVFQEEYTKPEIIAVLAQDTQKHEMVKQRVAHDAAQLQKDYPEYFISLKVLLRTGQF